MNNNDILAVETAQKLAQEIQKALDTKKAEEIAVIPVGDQTSLADFFVIATGTSNTHIRALADEVEFQTKETLQTEPAHIEGMGDNAWILMDYSSVIVHIFTREAREFYKLDKLWDGTPNKESKDQI
ncbi:MAG: ribosome silencing factor [Clostridia bacterium]